MKPRQVMRSEALVIAEAMRNPDHQIGFLVSCGYFRATRRFFAPLDFLERDIAYVASQLDHSDPAQIQYPDRTRQRHQNTILDFYGFASFDDDVCNNLVTEIAAMARMHLKPRLIFDRCVEFLIQKRVQIPSTYRLSDLIRSGLQDRKTELVALMDRHLSDDARSLLDDLFTAPDDQNRYRLTLLKKLSQSTRPTRIKEAVADFEILSDLHDQLGSVLSKLDLGTAGIRYFALRDFPNTKARSE